MGGAETMPVQSQSVKVRWNSHGIKNSLNLKQVVSINGTHTWEMLF